MNVLSALFHEEHKSSFLKLFIEYNILELVS